MRRLSAATTASRGGALIEFAFALALLVPVMTGGWQFYEAYLRMEELQHAAIRGVQYASNLPYESSGETPAPEFRRAVENMVLFRSPRQESGRPVVPGLQREMIQVSMRFERGRPSELVVAVTGYKVAVPGGSFLLQGKPRASYPYRGHWAAGAAGDDR